MVTRLSELNGQPVLILDQALMAKWGLPQDSQLEATIREGQLVVTPLGRVSLADATVSTTGDLQAALDHVVREWAPVLQNLAK